jgi:hypothetical protein
MHRKILALIVVALTFAACGTNRGPIPAHRLESIELKHRINGDQKRVKRYRHNVQAILSYLEARTDLLDVSKNETLTREQRETLWRTWERFLDNFLALESLRRYHANYWLVRDGKLKDHSFVVGYAAFLAQYAAALRWIKFASIHPDLDIVLNEPVPEIGLPKGSYDRFKLRYLNIAIATQFVALDSVDKNRGRPACFGLRKGLAEDTELLWKMGKGEGIRMTMDNAGAVVRKAGFKAYFPVQAGVSEWMGDTKVHRKGIALITLEQVAEVATMLEPGDILLERREWYLSNIGLPGYWPHAALYIGTPEERQQYFANDPEVAKWLAERGDAEKGIDGLLKAGYPEQYALHLKPDGHGHPHAVIEAISEGVSHTSLEHSAGCDTLAVIRPRVTKVQRAQAIRMAFHYAGRPYDFDFDNRTDAALVCTELVAKAYEGNSTVPGLAFPVTSVMDHKVTPANLIVKEFDHNFGTPAQQYDLVTFIDGYEKEGEAILSNLDAFRQSWKRPKWHIMVQDAPEPVHD